MREAILRVPTGAWQISSGRCKTHSEGILSDSPSVLEGFRPNPSNRLRASVRHLFRAKTQICDTVVRSELGGLKSAILSITFFSHFQNCDTVVLESGRV